MRKIIVVLLSTFASLLFGQNALHFDGIDDRVDCGNDASLQITNQLTLEAWIYANSWKINVFEGCIINKEQNVPDYGYMIRVGQLGRLGFNLGNGSWHEIVSDPLLSLNTWHHVAATYDGSKMRLFIDGNPVDSLNLSISIGNAANDLFIGDWYSSGRNFNGKIDEVRIWNVARTKAEIQAAMNTELCTLPPGLVAYYTFDQGFAGGTNTGNTNLQDQSGNGNTGSLGNFSLNGATSNWVTGMNLPGGSTSSSITVNACSAYTSPSGQYNWSTSGTYMDTIQNAAGCDSVITIDLTIVQVDIALGLSGGTLISNAINAYYQWVDCDNNYAPISGAVNGTFTPSAVGNYACIVTQYGCTDTSICVPITSVGLEEETSFSKLEVFPNPSPDGVISIDPAGLSGDFVVIDLTGRKVISTRLNGLSPESLMIPGPGLFFYRFKTEERSFSGKIVVR